MVRFDRLMHGLMRGLTFVLMGALTCLFSIAPRPAWASESSASASAVAGSTGFSFHSGKSAAELGQPPQFDTLAGPRKWSSSDQSEIEQIFADLRSRPELAAFFAKIDGDGPLSVERYKRYAYFVPSEKDWLVKDNSFAWAWAHSLDRRFIGFGDWFFRLSHPQTKRYVVLHELTHVFDAFSRFSMSKEYLDLLQWSEVDGEWRSGRVDSSKITDQTSDLDITNMFGFPTRYSLENPQESLAEFLAYIVLAPEYAERLAPDIVEFIRKNYLGMTADR